MHLKIVCILTRIICSMKQCDNVKSFNCCNQYYHILCVVIFLNAKNPTLYLSVIWLMICWWHYPIYCHWHVFDSIILDRNNHLKLGGLQNNNLAPPKIALLGAWPTICDKTLEHDWFIYLAPVDRNPVLFCFFIEMFSRNFSTHYHEKITIVRELESTPFRAYASRRWAWGWA